MYRLYPLIRGNSRRLSSVASTVDPFLRGVQLDHRIPELCSTQARFGTNFRSLSSASKKTPAKTNKPVTGTAGRIVLHQTSGKDGKAGSLNLCVGCGTEVVKGSRSRMAAGADAIDKTRSKTQAKKARYVDSTDVTGSNFLCERCKALKSDNIWKAYDALRDVPPKVFSDQLKHIVSRRRFGLCILVVDATDSEHTAVKRLRDAIGSTPVILVLNKIDLLPRMTRLDQRSIARKIQSSSVRFEDSFAVSAATGAGLVALAVRILSRLGGRDIFVVGSANVGKSSLVKELSAHIANTVRLKGTSKQAARRRDSTNGLKVTGSNLPGTTLQAVRVPCFPSRQHAMWDTPGIINSRALQYNIFPSHLMEPLTRPQAISIPTRENELVSLVRSGESILVEAGWVDDRSDDEEPFVLARVDVKKARAKVHTQAFLHPSLRVRVVATSEAPSKSTVPPSHIATVIERIRRATGRKETGLADHYSLPLAPFCNKEMPEGEMTVADDMFDQAIERYRIDIVFASLGWINFSDTSQYGVVPHCVTGSVFSKRRPLYPLNVGKWIERNGTPELEPDNWDDERVQNDIKAAAREGSHSDGVGRKGKRRRGDDIHDDWDDEEWSDEWY